MPLRPLLCAQARPKRWTQGALRGDFKKKEYVQHELIFEKRSKDNKYI